MDPASHARAAAGGSTTYTPLGRWATGYNHIAHAVQARLFELYNRTWLLRYHELKLKLCGVRCAPARKLPRGRAATCQLRAGAAHRQCAKPPPRTRRDAPGPDH